MASRATRKSTKTRTLGGCRRDDITAWTALIDTAKIERGMRVLIHGGAGAPGSVAVQLAKAHGLHVIATASGAGVALVKSLGADEVIDYRTQHFQELVTRVDVVLDTLGAPTPPRRTASAKAARRAERWC